MERGATDGRESGAEATDASHMAFSRGVGRGGLVVAVVALVPLAAVTIVARNRDVDAVGSASPDTSGSTGSVVAGSEPSSTRPPPVSGSALRPFATTTTSGPALHEISIVPDTLPYRIIGAHETDPEVPDGKEMFTAPTSKPEALIPGSASYLSSNAPDFTAHMIPESNYVALWWMSSSEKGDNLVGHLDPSTGEFRRSFSMTGCGFAKANRVVVSSAGVAHLWTVVYDTNTNEHLVDVDLNLGSVVWSARCTRCQELLAGNGVVRVLADPVNIRNLSLGEDSTSGAVELITVDVASHAVRAPVRLAGSIVRSDDGHLWSMAGTVLSKLDATTGAITSYSGSIQYLYESGLVAQRVVVAGGRAWEWTRQGTDGELMGYNLDTFVEEHRVPVERGGSAMFGGGRIWTVALNGSPEKDPLIIRAIDPRTGAMSEVAQFHSYERIGPRNTLSTHLPQLSFDATGFWYEDQIPTPATRANPAPGEPAMSDGPRHLMHVTVP